MPTSVQRSTPTRVLMCPPTYYEIPAEENPHMDVNEQPDKHKAWLQWMVIRNSYQRFGLDVYEMEPVPRYWDMIFTANGAWGRDRELVVANFRWPIRQDEKRFFKNWLKRLGCTVFELPQGIFFEGQGDVITLSDTYLFGAGFVQDARILESGGPEYENDGKNPVHQKHGARRHLSHHVHDSGAVAL